MDERTGMGEEDPLQRLRQEEGRNNKRLLSLELIIAYLSTISFMVLILAASLAVTSVVWRAVMIVAAIGIFAVGMVCSLRLERDAGYYECPNCGMRYVPSMRAVVMAPHVGRTRRMRCPRCGKRGWHKKVLTR